MFGTSGVPGSNQIGSINSSTQPSEVDKAEGNYCGKSIKQEHVDNKLPQAKLTSSLFKSLGKYDIQSLQASEVSTHLTDTTRDKFSVLANKLALEMSPRFNAKAAHRKFESRSK